jgi:hypothetical protein
MEPNWRDIPYAETRAKLLASRLERWSINHSLADEQDAVRRMGIDLRLWRRATFARVVNADAHLAICAEIGVEPVYLGVPIPAQPLAGPIQWHLFGMALFLRREQVAHCGRKAAEVAGVSVATVSRAEGGHPLSFDGFARLAAYVGQHPHAFTHRVQPGERPRSTGNTDCNTLNKQRVSAP